MTLYCKSVESLPPFISLESLKSLTLSACSSLKKFPDIEGNMESLLELNLDGTAIEDLPPSFGLLTGRSCLNLGDCKNLSCLPSSIKYLTSLKSLILAGCSKLDGIPENLNCFEFLEMLDLSGTALSQTSSFAGINNHRRSFDIRLLFLMVGWKGSFMYVPKNFIACLILCLLYSQV